MNRKKLTDLADNAIDNYFESDIDDIVNNMVNKIIESENIDDEDDIKYLRMRIKRGILKLDIKIGWSL